MDDHDTGRRQELANARAPTGALDGAVTVSLVVATDARADYYNCPTGLLNTGTADDQADGSSAARRGPS